MSTTELKPIAKMTVAELRAELELAGVSAPVGAKKDLLVTLVETARDGEPIEGEVVVEEVEQKTRHLPAVQQHEALIARAEVSPEEVKGQLDKIRQVMDAVMTKGVHYGEIPGVNKPTLLKPGAEVLAVTLRLAPSYQSEKTFHGDGHLTVVSKALLTHIPTGLVIAEGEGLCSSMEKKYAYRGEGRTCPTCGAAGTIKKSKYPPRANDYPGAKQGDPPGWYCYAKVGGCGANFAANDPAIISQSGERVPNPDLPDTWNTVLKMADKRALVAAILNGTAASDIFTQDVEDAGADVAADSHEYAGGDYGGEGMAEEERAAKFGGDRRTGAWHGPDGYGGTVSPWKELGDRLARRLGADDVPEWLGQLAELYGFPSIGDVIQAPEEEVSTDRKRDLWHRLLVVLEALESDPSEFLGAAEIQAAFAKGFDGISLAGPRREAEATEEPVEAAAHSSSPDAEEQAEVKDAEQPAEAPAAVEEAAKGEDDDLPAF